MDFQVVVLAGGTSKKLVPLVSKELPKALLPVANRPVISYVLELLELSNLKDIIVAVEGKEAHDCVEHWTDEAYIDRLRIKRLHIIEKNGQREFMQPISFGTKAQTKDDDNKIGPAWLHTVERVPDDVGTAGALRAVAHLLTAKDILVVSGDIVSDVSPGAVAAAHRRHDAVVTTMLCSAPVSGPSDSGSSVAKDKGKKPGHYDRIGLDPTKQFLLYIATGTELEKDIRIQKSILCAVGQMEIRSDLMDAHLYAFKRSVLQEVLKQKDKFQSLKRDVLPYLVRTQLSSEVLLNGVPQPEENGHEKSSYQNNEEMLSQILANSSTASFHELYALGSRCSFAVRRTHKCCVYIASNSKYCMRLNSIQAFNDINRDVIGDASHLSGYSFSAQNNIIHLSAELGSKTTVGPHCMLGEASIMGDKCSVKRSVIGRHCRIGSNVKVVNSVVMNHVSIADGCTIQNSVICSNVQLQERVVLKDCQVGANFVVTTGSECKGEALARKEK